MRRRDFIKASAFACAVSAVPLPMPILAKGLAIDADVRPLSKTHFKKLLNHQFAIHNNLFSTQDVKLIAIDEELSNPELEQFTLTFKGKPSQVLGSNTYWLSHVDEGGFQLYLETKKSEVGDIQYCASFSLLKT